MKNHVDLVIIGGGLAGITLYETALSRGLSCLILDNPDHSGSSWASGALLHPLVFKKLTIAWPGLEACKSSIEFYQHIAPNSWHPLLIYRRIANQNEFDQWKKKALDPYFSQILGPLSSDYPFLQTKPRSARESQLISSTFGFGRVQIGGWLDVETFLSETKSLLERKGEWIQAEIKPTDLEINHQLVLLPKSKRILHYNHLILATGISDPAWKQLLPKPWDSKLSTQGFYGVKGDCIDLYLPELALDDILLGPVFLIPLGQGYLRVGSTYQREFLDDTPENSQALELCTQLEAFIHIDRNLLMNRIQNHRAGIRPATKDRRPYLGQVANHLWVYNGLGTRGLLVAPYLARLFVDHLVNGTQIPNEFSLDRIQNS